MPQPPSKGGFFCALLAMFKNLSRLTFWQFRQVIRLWNRHGCVDLSAAFAFHSLQSIFPFLLLCFGVAARVFGQADGALEQILDFADQVLPPGSRFVIADVLETLIAQGRAAGIIGAFALLITASNATLSLQRGYDRLWLGFKEPLLPNHSWFWHFSDLLLQRAKAIFGALLLAFLLLINQLTTPFKLIWLGIWSSLASWSLVLPEVWQLPARSATSVFSSWCALLIGIALLFSFLPRRRPPLKFLWYGALFVATTLTLLNPLLGSLLIWLSSRFLAYGLVGGVIVLNLWVWLIGLILYFGMTLTVVRRSRNIEA